jgi:hypothetical protein
MTAGNYMKPAPKPTKPWKPILVIAACALLLLVASFTGVHKPNSGSVIQILAAGAGLTIFFFLIPWGAGLLVIWIWKTAGSMRSYLTGMWTFLTRR